MVGCPLQRYDPIRSMCMVMGEPAQHDEHNRWQLGHQLASAEKAIVPAAPLQEAWWRAARAAPAAVR